MKSALRLRRGEDFARARRTGRVFYHPAMILNIRANAGSCNRYGIVIGRRFGIAVQRNRCKRQLRALLQEMHKELQQGYDIVLVARRQLQGQPFRAMRRIVLRLLDKAGLLGKIG